ncbi:unnamed protein product, partial [Ascophyllum nodosum]
GGHAHGVRSAKNWGRRRKGRRRCRPRPRCRSRRQYGGGWTRRSGRRDACGRGFCAGGHDVEPHETEGRSPGVIVGRGGTTTT